MVRPHRQTAEAETTQQSADRAFSQPNTELLLNLLRQIDQPPPHHTVFGQLWPLPNPLRHLRLLLRCQPRRSARMRSIKKSAQTLGVVAMHPVAQNLSIHAAKCCRIAARAPIQDMRQGQHSPRRIAVMGSRRNPPQLPRRTVRACNTNRRRHRPLRQLESEGKQRITSPTGRESPRESKIGTAGIILMMPEPRLRPLVERFSAMLLEIPAFAGVYGTI